MPPFHAILLFDIASPAWDRSDIRPTRLDGIAEAMLSMLPDRGKPLTALFGLLPAPAAWEPEARRD